MKINWYAIILAFACLILGAFLFKGCQHEKAMESRYQDSIRIRGIVIDSVKKKADTLLMYSSAVVAKSHLDSANSRHREDSLLAENKVLKSKYVLYRDSANSLWAQLKTDYLNGDTLALRIAYYSLKEQLDSANSQVMAIQFRDERVEYELRNEADSAHATIRTLYAQLEALKSLLDRQTQIAESANREEGKILAVQKRKKIWDIVQKVGIGIAGLFLGSKL